MRKNALAFIVCMTAMVFSQAQQVVEDNFQRLQVNLSVGELHTGKTEMLGRMFTELQLEGMQPSSLVGAPNLPTWSGLIEVPMCSGFEVEVTGVEYDTVQLTGAVVAPVQPSRSKSDTENHPLLLDEKIYSVDSFFSSAPLALVEHVGVARDRNLARLQFSPVRYNPVRGIVVVCRKATVTVRYRGADEEGSIALFNRYHSPMFGIGGATLNKLYPKSVRDASPVRYLIVAHSMFRGQLDDFVNWKRRKGFITDIVYTDDAAVGTTSTSIAEYVKSQYDNATMASPAPTFLLIVGDHEQIPAFSAQVTSPSSDHITDLYYATWTSGDHIPDCYMGRFSAQNVSQLTPQLEKTLMYEQYTFADPSFLDRAVMVAGVDGGSSGDNGYRYGDPAMDYAITNYVNGAHGFSEVHYFKNDVSIVPSGSNVTVGSSSGATTAASNYYNQGAGWINYSAHGSATSWGNPSFTTSNASAMTNTQKFGIMIGNCCLTNKFEVTTCLGESLLRKDNYCGAVGYIGGSNSTYWAEDFYWAVGVRSSISPTMSMAYNSSNLGNYDRSFHTHNEAYSDWATTQGSLVMYGNMSVENSSVGTSYKYYYWEIYHLMGDPSVMPYLTQASTMTMVTSSVVMVGTNTLSVTAAPYAYVALTDTVTRTLWASAFADASGIATLTLPSGLPVGGYELAASAQQYRTAFQTVSVVPSSGPYPVAVGIEPTTLFEAGSTVPLRISVANIGSSSASGVTVTLTSDNPLVTLSSSTVSVGNIQAGDTVTVMTVSATASPQAMDGSHATVTASTQWSGSTTQTSYGSTLTVNAPVAVMTVVPSATSLLPDSTMTVTVNVVNQGHAALGESQLMLTSPVSGITVTPGSAQTISSLAQGATFTRQFQLYASSTIDTDIYVPVYVCLSGVQTKNDTLQIYIGTNVTETFEGGLYQVQGWTQGTYPWGLTSEESYDGAWSARSADNLGHSNTSEMSIVFSSPRADSVSFYYKVSSEANYDKFHCYLDGLEMIVASGLVDWTREAIPVTSGTHLLLFSYSKDGSMNSNEDCAWIDNIALPHGSRIIPSSSEEEGGGEGGSGEEVSSFEPLAANFDSDADDSRWTLVNGSLRNVWFIGSAGANGAGRGLYITNDGGQTNAYTVRDSASSVFAYTTLWLDTGSYAVSFDWRCNGESTYDYLRAALVPASITLMPSSTVPSGWSSSSMPSGAIALDGGQKLNLSSTWNRQDAEVHVGQSGRYNLVFFWRNDASIGNMPPAAIDNVSLSRVTRYSVTVTAAHGVTTGSGVYQSGDTANVGVFPEAGYTFVGWNDGNGSNPRQLIVDGILALEAMLAQGGVVTLHDTTNVIVHDTTVVTRVDTVEQTVYVNVWDTVFIEVYMHDTTFVDVYMHDTTIVTDTVVMTQNVEVHDTSYVSVHDTTYLEFFIHDTTWVTLTDTVVQTDTLRLLDTLTITEYVPVHDTTYLEVFVHDTAWVVLTDTVVQTDSLTLLDTVFLTEYVSVHDTTYIDVHDTTYIDVWVYDTTILTDTVTLTEYVPVHDTTIVTDTVTLTEYVPVHDTTYIDVHDTTYISVIVHDTTVLTDTLVIVNMDTLQIVSTDTLYDIVIDTIWLTNYDTIIVHDTVINYVTLVTYDTIVIHDTIYLPGQGIERVGVVTLQVYADRGQVVVEGAEGGLVTLFDLTGRVLATRRDEYSPLRFDVPCAGTYLIKVDDRPAHKIVVIR